jgi:hypothetical protein
VSCSAPGDCVVGGDASSQDDNYGSTQDGWVATETGGQWSALVPVIIGWTGWPGRYITVNSVSCASPGNCAAVGYDSQEIEPEGSVDTYGAYVIDETGGTWGTAALVAGFRGGGQPFYGGASPVISCAKPGDCTVAGTDAAAAGATVTSVATETDGT